MTTVTGTIKLPSGAAYRGNVKFVPITTPNVNGSQVVLTRSASLRTDEEGAFTTSLSPGSYEVRFDTTVLDTIRFLVPDSEGTYDLALLVAESNPQLVVDMDWNFRIIRGVWCLWNGTLAGYQGIYLEGEVGAERTVFGEVMTDIAGPILESNFRVKSGKVQLWNGTLARWQSLDLVGNPPQMVYGTPEL